MRLFLLLSLSLIFSQTIFGQTKRDSLVDLWNDSSANDSLRLAAAHELVWKIYLHTAPDSARVFAKEQLQLAQKVGTLRQISQAYNNIGVSYHAQGDLKNATPYYQLSLQADEERAREKDSDNVFEGIAASHTNLAIIYHQIGDMPLAMESYYRALQLLDSLEQIGIPVNIKIANVQNNIGMTQETQGSSSDALMWYFRALERFEKESNSIGLGNVLTNIGNALHRLSDAAETIQLRDSLTAQANSFYFRSLEVRKEIGDRRGEANILNNIASNLQRQASKLKRGDQQDSLYIESEMYYRHSIAVYEEVNDMYGLSSTMANFSQNLLLQNRFREAIQYGESALKISREIGNIESVSRASRSLYPAYKKTGQALKALEMYELHIQMNDSIRNEENTRFLIRKEYEYDYSKREALLIAEQEKRDAIAVLDLNRRKLQRNAFIVGFGMMLLLAIVFFSQRLRISREKERSESLLLNILPAETAKELKEKGHAEAQLIDQVTVLFTDFKGFTALSEKVTPKELVHDLHECFSAFDRICGKYGIEKIKTIGDAYMAAGGLPTPNNTHAEDVVRAALEMSEFVEQGKQMKIERGEPFFEIRVGVHTGPVVAGIVGIKKFQYDIWGDTVNTASRMESSGEVGKVNISKATYDLLKNEAEFTFENRGKIEAKGKGEIEMVFVSMNY